MQLNRQYRDMVRETVQSLAISLPGDDLVEEEESANIFNLTGGEYSGKMFKSGNTHVRGLSASSSFNSQVKVAEDAVIDGVRFVSSPENMSSLVYVSDGVRCVFRNCVFEKTLEADSWHIEMVSSTTKILAVGCVFIGPLKTSILLNPGGVAANAVFVGCSDLTGSGYGTSTQVGCL
tara:strand:+ start:120 stop:650 length:531 start_codon:yes stop_codon:yes gene_type:complete